MINRYIQILEELRLGKPVLMETVIGKTLGKKLVMQEQFPDDSFYQEVIENKRTGIEKKEEETRVIEPFFPKERLILLGGGHVALPLCRLGAQIGFSVIVIDDRPLFANSRRFPEADQVICNNFRDGIRQLGITSYDYMVIITRGHRYDHECLEEILKGEEPAYMGMMGSRRRIHEVMEKFKKNGHKKELLDKLDAPIGLPIGALTPEEIAVSITGILINCRRKGTLNLEDPFTKRILCAETDHAVLELLAKDRTRKKAVVTIIADRGSAPRKTGAKMLVYEDGNTEGSIGGGCSESEAIQEARTYLRQGRSGIYTVSLTNEMAEDDGMVCGGSIDVLIECDNHI